MSLIRKMILLPGKIPLALKIELKSLAVFFRYGQPDVALDFTGGLGDELLLSIVAQELKKRTPELRIWQISPAAELLMNNPCYDKIFTPDYWYLRHSNLLNSRRCRINGYVNTIIHKEQYEPPTEHIAAVMCRKAGIQGQINIEPRVYLSDREIEDAYFAKGAVVVSYPGKDSYEHMKNNRLWDIVKFLKVIEILQSGEQNSCPCSVIQLGSPKDPPLEGAMDLRGKTSLRQSAAILRNCSFFFGFPGLLMHLARAVDCRSVIIFGGLEYSGQSGYICNENIESSIDCAPCWRPNHCERGRECLSAIAVDDVLVAVQKLLSRDMTALEVDTVVI